MISVSTSYYDDITVSFGGSKGDFISMIWIISASLIWAFSFGLIKSKTAAIDPYVLGVARTGIAALFFLPWFLRESKIAIPRRTYVQAAICGFIQIGLMYGPYLLSFRYLKAHEVALSTMTTPIIMAVFIKMINREINWRLFAAVLLATAGGMLASGGSFSGMEGFHGFILVQLSNLLFATGLILWNRWISDVEAQQPKLMFPFFAGAFLASILLAIFLAKNLRPYTQDEWLLFAYLGVVASGIGFFLWNKGALKVSAGVLSAANNLKLPIAILVSLTVFGESADLIKLISGTALIVLGVKMASRPSLKPVAK